MRKKLLAIIAAMAMVMTMIPAVAFADAGLPEPVNGVITLENDVTLTNDVTLADDVTIVVPAGKEVTLNLNEKTLSGKATTSTTSYLIKVAGGGKLTVTEGTISFYATTPDTEWGGEGQPPYPGYANNTVRNEGTIVVNGATIENKTAPGGASYVIDNYAGSNLTINSGKIDGHGKTAIRMFTSSAEKPINVTVNDGTITGNRAIWVHLAGSNSAVKADANLTVNGGTLESTDDVYNMAIYVYSYGNSFEGTDVKITGGTLDDVAFTGGTKTAETGAENVEITGGIINDTYGYGTGANDIGKYISGGQFNEDVSAYVADDSALVKITDAAGTTAKYYVGDDVEEAVKNAESGSTIEILQAPEGTELESVPGGVKVENSTDTTVTVNGIELEADDNMVIEEADDSDEEGTTPPAGDKADGTTQTGDTSNMTVPFALAGLAVVAMAAVVLARRKQSQK